MPNDSFTSAQGQAWDQIALIKLGSEKQMGIIIPLNLDETDAIFFSGGQKLEIPAIGVETVKSLPPWERM